MKIVRTDKDIKRRPHQEVKMGRNTVRSKTLNEATHRQEGYHIGGRARRLSPITGPLTLGVCTWTMASFEN